MKRERSDAGSERETAEGKIVSIVEEQVETNFIAEPAIEQIPAAIVEAQSFDMDVVSGATVTSKAIIAAVQDGMWRP